MAWGENEVPGAVESQPAVTDWECWKQAFVRGTAVDWLVVLPSLPRTRTPNCQGSGKGSVLVEADLNPLKTERPTSKENTAGVGVGTS